MKTPQLAICIPTKDRPDLLRDTLRSCVTQSDIDGYDVEICVADNSTTDAAARIVAEFKPGPIPIKYHRHGRDIGLDANMLHVLGMASAEYALWLGDDDELQPGALQDIIQELALKPDFLLLNGHYCSADMSRVHGQVVRLTADTDYQDPAAMFLAHWYPMPTGQIPFGVFVVRTQKLSREHIDPFIGTYHAYAAYVFLYLHDTYEHAGKIAARVLSKPLVKLRTEWDSKTWKDSTTIVWFHSVPDWLYLIGKIPLYRQMALAKRTRYLRNAYKISHLLKVRRNNPAHWHLIPKPASIRLRVNYWLVSAVPVRLQLWIRNLRPKYRNASARN